MEQLAFNIRPCTPLDLDKLVVLIEKHAEFEKAVFTTEGKLASLEAALFGEQPPLNCIVA
ncbi:hypothetical protein [Pedobacter frigidisoli]|uniref:hypothetical protein n=1 Tax=Pedobacter frigidisoli TaxID=2530455 RepID=UPI00292EA6FD|nr:hypothetical protein [Pedobacter frigidisoli]